LPNNAFISERQSRAIVVASRALPARAIAAPNPLILAFRETCLSMHRHTHNPHQGASFFMHFATLAVRTNARKNQDAAAATPSDAAAATYYSCKMLQLQLLAAARHTPHVCAHYRNPHSTCIRTNMCNACWSTPAFKARKQRCWMHTIGVEVGGGDVSRTQAQLRARKKVLFQLHGTRISSSVSSTLHPHGLQSACAHRRVQAEAAGVAAAARSRTTTLFPNRDTVKQH